MATQIDQHGRYMRKLRVSLLDACNFRCFYCMPLNPVFMNKKEWLNVDEIVTICSYLVDFGVEQIRLTGGEPFLRPEFEEIVSRLSELPIAKMGVTTNGFSLLKHLEFLKNTKCQHINVSLDSLNEKNFAHITRSSFFSEVKEGIISAAEMGFPVKINAVLMRGVNDHEIFDFIDFSAKYNVEVRFLELMRIGQARELGKTGFISASEVIESIETRYKLHSEKVDVDSTSFNFTLENGARVGFIASETRPFCEACSRLRLSADGLLRACLMAQGGLSLKDLSSHEVYETLIATIQKKPNFRQLETPVDMNRLGG